MTRDWTRFVQRRLSAEPIVTAELAEQLEDVYAAALAEGKPESEACRLAEAHVQDWPALARAIARSRAPVQARLPLPLRMAWAVAGFGRDLRRASRSLRQAPGFSFAAMATLALGIGLVFAMFGLADALILRPLPLPQPDRVMAMLETSRQFPRMGVDWPDFLDWKASSHSFSQLAATRGTLQILAHLGPATTVAGLRVTPDYFALLGAKPALGRLLLASDDQAGSPDVVVVSWSFFQSRLSGDRSWMGRQLDLDGRLRTVVGVTPTGFPGFSAGNDPQIWEPLGSFISRNPDLIRRSNHSGILVLGRLAPGTNIAQARAEMAVHMHALARQFPATNAHVEALLQSLPDFLSGAYRSTLLLLLAAAGMVLLIACLNVVNLVLARLVHRARELQVRSALGASRVRLFTAQFAECLLLCLSGGILGMLLAQIALKSVAPFLPALGLPSSRLGLDPRALALALLAVLVCALVCGLATLSRLPRGNRPARMQARGDHATSLRGRTGGVLIAAEMAGSVVLLIAASLVLHGLVRLQGANYGFQPRGVFSFIVGLSAHYPDPASHLNFFRESEERLAQLPGVSTAGGVFPLPLAGFQVEEPFLVAGRSRPQTGHEPTADIFNIRGDYIGAMQIPVLAGRVFTSSDSTNSAPVAMVDSALALSIFGHSGIQGAVGQRLNLDGVNRTIVGVVDHVQDRGLAGLRVSEIYIPQDQGPGFDAMSYVLRVTGGDPNQLRAPAVASLAKLDPNLAATEITTLDQTVISDLAPRRAAAGVLAACAVLALSLACFGIYGVISFLVARRTHEIGIRMALGANRSRVLTSVLRHGLLLAVVGAAVGVLLATQLSRSLGLLLYATPPLDPATYLLAPLLLLCAATLACLVPALRATRVDPLRALRTE